MQQTINSISRLNVDDTDACILNAVGIMFNLFGIVQITTPVQWLLIVTKSQPQVKERACQYPVKHQVAIEGRLCLLRLAK